MQREMCLPVCHVLTVHIEETLRGIFRWMHRGVSRNTSLQRLVNEVNDFPKRRKIRLVERAKDGHDDVLIPRIPIVGKDSEYRNTVVGLFIAAFR